MRCPSSRTSPPVMRPGGSSRPITAAPVSDLPAPDSPTTPSTSPAAMSKETPSTATSLPRRPRKATSRLRTDRTGSLIATWPSAGYFFGATNFMCTTLSGDTGTSRSLFMA